MSGYRTGKTAGKGDLPKIQAPPGTNGTMEMATYVGDLLRGMRQFTREGRKDLAFLDYLLAMAEEESMCLAANMYH